MMKKHEQEFGLVLQKTKPHEYFCWVLGPRIGLHRLQVSERHLLERLHPGTLITFSRWHKPGRQIPFVTDLDLIATNPAVCLPNLQWIALLLALTRWSAEEHQEAQALFMHLCACLSLVNLNEQNPQAEIPYKPLKIAYTCALLHLLGHTPPRTLEAMVHTTLVHTSQHANFDASCAFHQNFLQTIGRTLHNSLALQSNAWIDQCIKSHPLHQRFTSFVVF